MTSELLLLLLLVSSTNLSIERREAHSTTFETVEDMTFTLGEVTRTCEGSISEVVLLECVAVFTDALCACVNYVKTR